MWTASCSTDVGSGRCRTSATRSRVVRLSPDLSSGVIEQGHHEWSLPGPVDCCQTRRQPRGDQREVRHRLSAHRRPVRGCHRHGVIGLDAQKLFVADRIVHQFLGTTRGGASRSDSAFAGFRFPAEVIVLAVRCYLRFDLSYRDVEELLTERGIEVDHFTVVRWVQRFTPLLVDAARRRALVRG